MPFARDDTAVGISNSLAHLSRLSVLLILFWAPHSALAASATEPSTLSDGSITITELTPDPRGGKAYRLEYNVAVPIDIMWKFKTDFDNVFLLENQYIQSHRLISRSPQSVITENRYHTFPVVRFLWQTTLSADHHSLHFKLLNASQARHKFHYGSIQLTSRGAATQVTQVAYFDFLGVSLWAHNPWGGMSEFLTYNARWEQNMVKQRSALYMDTERSLEP